MFMIVSNSIAGVLKYTLIDLYKHDLALSAICGNYAFKR